MDLIFCKHKKAQKTWISFFASLTLSLPTGNGIMKIQKITFLYLQTDLEGFWTLEKVL